MQSILESVLAAAVRAPSGDNTQPWRFVIDPRQNHIRFYVDETRDPSPMNAGQRMARIAIGAALENIVQAVEHAGGQVRVEPSSPPEVAIVHVEVSGDQALVVPEVIQSRVTNRKPYDRRPVSAPTLALLRQATDDIDRVETHWITEPARCTALAALIGRADALMLGESAMRRAFLSKVHFNEPADAPVFFGLSTASLELSAFERLTFPVLGRMPDWLLKVGGITGSFARRTRKLVEHSSGLCLVSAPDEQEWTDVLVGRAMQRAWLALTDQKLAAQPMMSLPVLENVLANGPADLIAKVGRERIRALRDRIQELVPEFAGRRLAALLRFGFAPQPSARVGRLPVEAVLSEYTNGSNVTIE
jgi:hypothetical protein